MGTYSQIQVDFQNQKRACSPFKPAVQPRSFPVLSLFACASNMGQQASRIVELENGSDIYVGGLQAVNEVVLDEHNVGAVVNCCESLPHMRRMDRRMRVLELAGKYEVLRLNWKDERSQQLVGLDAALRVIHDAVLLGKSVLIHCEQGRSRSGSVMVAYMMAAHGMSRNAALLYVKDRRSIVSPNTGFMKQLADFEVNGTLAELRAEFAGGPAMVAVSPPPPSNSPSTPPRAPAVVPEAFQAAVAHQRQAKTQLQESQWDEYYAASTGAHATPDDFLIFPADVPANDEDVDFAAAEEEFKTVQQQLFRQHLTVLDKFAQTARLLPMHAK